MPAATSKPIQTVEVQPAVSRDISSARPTETRYGWCPYNDINLVGPDGTMAFTVQPPMIETEQGVIQNPYGRVLPKNQLVPFPSFVTEIVSPSPDLTDSRGRAVLTRSAMTITALDAVTTVLRAYSSWGFVVLNSLQGMEQNDAMRIFQVVQPLDYPLGQLENELTFGALERIDATDPIKISEDYSIEPLTTDYDRSIARQLAEELAGGASIAFVLGNITLDESEASMTQRYAGGQGKAGPDPNDIRLSKELNRELPKLLGNQKDDLGDVKEQIKFLANREASRADKEEIERLKAKVAELESGPVSPTVTINEHRESTPKKKKGEESGFKVGDAVTINGREGTFVKPFFGRYQIEFEDGTIEKHTKEELNT